MAIQQNLDALNAALKRHPEGITAAKAAVLIGVPLRTARSYLTTLLAEGKVRRDPTYCATRKGQQVFSWVYRVAA